MWGRGPAQRKQIKKTKTVNYSRLVLEEEQKYLPSYYSINIGSDCAVIISEVTAQY
jgi:hypothetical protein